MALGRWRHHLYATHRFETDDAHELPYLFSNFAELLVVGAMQLFFSLVTLLGLDREGGDWARF